MAAEVLAAGFGILPLAELALVAVSLGVVLVWLGHCLSKRWWRAAVVGIPVGLLLSLLVVVFFTRDRPLREDEISDRPIQVPGDGYVSSDACQACHPREYQTWHASYHRRMTQVASSETVIGDFDNVQLAYHGVNYRLFRDKGTFWFETDGGREDGARPERHARPIVLTTGSHHMQAYWYPVGVGRALEFFPFIFLIPEQRWAARESVFLQPTVPVRAPLMPLTEEQKWQQDRRWNHSCIHCHTTHGEPQFPEIDTHVAELGIACEACHGEGKEHVEANRDPLRRYRLHLSGDRDDSITEPSRLSSKSASQVCGQCHSIQYPHPDEWDRQLRTGRSYRPGEELIQSVYLCQASHGEESLELCGKANQKYQFWGDGMLRVTGREYIGLLDSPCYQRGDLGCLSCHQLHKRDDDERPLEAWADDQLAPGMRGNQACLQCHKELAGEGRLVEHTGHQAGSSGSECMNCHMSYTSYGLLKAIRSHQISSPSVAASLETGRPNACNQCHLDKTLAWAGKHLASSYGQAMPHLSDVESSVPASLIWLLSGDAGQRALMAWSLGWQPAVKTSGSEWLAPALFPLLSDPYDAVRLIALRSLRKQEAFRDLEYDTMGTPAELRAAAVRAREIWQSLPAAARRDLYDLLDDPEGRLPPDVLEHLYEQRDNRTVMLTE